VLGMLISLGIVIGGAYLALTCLPGPDDLTQNVAPPSSLILDRNGRLLYEVIPPNAGKNTPILLDQIPVACRQATIATEDRRFCRHPGVDPIAIIRAAWQNWRAGYTVSGGSTITQQLARNLFLSPQERIERSLRRKLWEAWLALNLERRYSKDEILTLYLNQTYYGHFAFGIEAAAQAYFGKSAQELDLAECALLAGLPQYPTGYNPLQNLDAARYRQGIVLDLMVKEKYISRSEAELARREPLQFATTPFPIHAPHFVMYVEGLLEEQLGKDWARQGGLRIYTTLDLDWQQQAESIVRRRLAMLRPCKETPATDELFLCDPDAAPDRRIDNAALVAMDPQTGEILAMVGSPNYFDKRIRGNVNAALSLRQPGSAIKPITYAAAFDPEQAHRFGYQVLTPATMVSDVRTAFPTQEGVPYVPLNYDLEFHGPVLLRQALASSFNIPAVKVLYHIGLDALLDQAWRMGITSLQDADRYGLALTLGGGEVSLLELTGAYAAFANGGHRVRPKAILRIEHIQQPTDQAQQVTSNQQRERNQQIGESANESRATSNEQQVTSNEQPATSPQVAYLITDILSDDTARLPAFGEGSVLKLDRPAAAKTGTTTDWRDNWTVGYTPDLVVGVWVGNADNKPMRDVSGITGAGPIWHDFMTAILRNRPVRHFQRPDGLVEVEICADSGLLPTELCPRRRTELFIAGTEPTEYDTWHQLVRLDSRTGQRATANTPPQFVVKRVFTVYPAELQDWARQHDIPQPPPPLSDYPLPIAHQLPATSNQQQVTGNERSATSSTLMLIAPDNLATYRISPELPRDLQRIELAALPGDGLRLDWLVFLVDGVQVARVERPPYRAWWPLQPGEHEITAEGQDTRGYEVKATPVRVTVRGKE
ncbi:MAG TPA: PBP1A family penicillin-binding protein, partial [Anaerolineae bacterium]|nr:PBP1A family penicillin-binding protein [Anaerolineae bacterium]